MVCFSGSQQIAWVIIIARYRKSISADDFPDSDLQTGCIWRSHVWRIIQSPQLADRFGPIPIQGPGSLWSAREADEFVVLHIGTAKVERIDAEAIDGNSINRQFVAPCVSTSRVKPGNGDIYNFVRLYVLFIDSDEDCVCRKTGCQKQAKDRCANLFRDPD